MYSKKQRHEKIIELIKTENIYRQEDIVKKLNNLGYMVTQATVSRDIRDLNLSKQSVNGTAKYVIAQEKNLNNSNKLIEIFHSCVTSIKTAQNLVVIKTLSGAADAAASALDSVSNSLILGTIAGDDTILVITQSESDANTVKNKISDMII
ncbi:MAG: arginine repressor [Clostridia bacterium]|nr:arginine repressor [Clostridia bacterium]